MPVLSPFFGRIPSERGARLPVLYLRMLINVTVSARFWENKRVPPYRV